MLPNIVVQCSTPTSVRKVLVSNLSLVLDYVEFLDVLLTVHLSIILVINQLDAQYLVL